MLSLQKDKRTFFFKLREEKKILVKDFAVCRICQLESGSRSPRDVTCPQFLQCL